MEPETAAFLRRIVTTISVTVLWMAINATAGIMFDYAFIHGKMSLGNIIFYTWFLASFIFFLWFLIKLWNKPLDIPM